MRVRLHQHLRDGFGVLRGEDLVAELNEFAVEVELKGTQFVLNLAGTSELLAAIVPKDVVRCELDLAMGWAAGRTYLRGGTALEVAFPVHVSLGPLSVEAFNAFIKTEMDAAALIAKAASLKGQ